MEMSHSPSGIMQAYSPPLSLWGLVEQHVPSFEQDEVRSMLGCHIVDQSLELHNEIEMLLDIWRDIRDEVQEAKLIQSRLPEPPNQRERLIQEINFFTEGVKEKAKLKGIDPSDLLKNHNSNIIDYASDFSRPGSSMGRSSRSSDGRETPMMTASSERLSMAYEVTDEVEAVRMQLNVDKFDEICSHLRSTLVKEVEQLLADIEFLQDCLDNEANVRDCIDTPLTSREPTLTELREERASLEKELLLTDNLTFTPQVEKPIFNDSFKKPLPATSVTAPINLANTSRRQSPVKANHLITSQMSKERQSTPPSSARLSSKSGSDFPLKAIHDVQFTKSATECNTDTSLSPRNSTGVIKRSRSHLPSPPNVSLSESSLKQKPSIASQNSSLVDGNIINTSRFNEGKTATKVNRGRRTVSPGRVRVVNLNSIVGVHSGKGTSSSNNSEGSMSSNPLLPFSPVPPPDSTGPALEPSIRPSSADRFRKMVMGLRDGE